MFNEELYNELKRRFEEKDISDILDFFLVVSKSKGMFFNGDIEKQIIITDVDTYMEIIDDYFQNKDKYRFRVKPDAEENPYEIFKPCYDTIMGSQEFLDILAEKLNEMEYTEGTRFEIIDILNILLSFSIHRKDGYTRNIEDPSEDYQEYDDEYEETSEVIEEEANEDSNEKTDEEESKTQVGDDVKFYDEKSQEEYYKEHGMNPGNRISEEEFYAEEEVDEEKAAEDEYYEEMCNQALYNLREAISEKIQNLSIRDFIELNLDVNSDYYGDIIARRVEEMDEVEFYVYLIHNSSIDDLLSDIIIEKKKSLNSPLINNTYSALTQKEYSIKGNKIEYLKELRGTLINKIEENIEEYEEIVSPEDPEQFMSVPKWSKKDFKQLEENPEFIDFLDKVSKLNDQEFIIYFYSNIVELKFKKCKKESELLKKRINDLTDIDLQTLYYMLYNGYLDYPDVTEAMENRELMQIETIQGKKFTEEIVNLRDEEEVFDRETLYLELDAFEIDGLIIVKPLARLCSNETKAKMQECQYRTIKVISQLEKCGHVGIANTINQLNKTEKSDDFEDVDYNFYKYDEELGDYQCKNMSSEEMLNIYKQKCKYALVKYLNKKLLNMPEVCLGLIDTLNEDGVFNPLINVRLEKTELKYKKKDSEENSK